MFATFTKLHYLEATLAASLATPKPRSPINAMIGTTLVSSTLPLEYERELTDPSTSRIEPT